MRPMAVIVPKVGPEHRPQVGFVVDEHPVGTLGPRGAYPAFGIAVRPLAGLTTERVCSLGMWPSPWLLHVCSAVAFQSGSGRYDAASGRGRLHRISAGIIMKSQLVATLNPRVRVQVPGGAPVLTCDFSDCRSFYAPGLSPCLLASTAPAIQGLSKNGPSGARCRAMHPWSRAVSYGRRRSGLTRPMV
jgi:hypothetical protein